MLVLRNLLLLLAEVTDVGLLLDWLLVGHVDSCVERGGVHHWHRGLHLWLSLRVPHRLLLLRFKRRVIEGNHLRLLLLWLLGKLRLHWLADHLLLLIGSTLVVAGGHLLLHRVGASRLLLRLARDELRLLNCYVLLLSDWLLLGHTLLLLLVLLFDR